MTDDTSFLNLVSSISKIQKEDLQGCMMTSAKYVYSGRKQCESYVANIVYESEKGMTILAQGLEKSGEVVQSLLVKLMKNPSESGGQNTEKSRIVSEEKEIKQQWMMEFSYAQVEDYLHKTGDTNAIHKGEHAVVPGLYIVCECLQKYWKLYESVHADVQEYEQTNVHTDLQAKFFRPVYVGEVIHVQSIKQEKTGEQILIIQKGEEQCTALKMKLQSGE